MQNLLIKLQLIKIVVKIKSKTILQIFLKGYEKEWHDFKCLDLTDLYFQLETLL